MNTNILFSLDNVMPDPLRGQVQNSNIWECRQQIEAGKRYFVLAASGRGKTTLQHVLYGIRKDYSGGISVLLDHTLTDIRQLRLEQWAALRQNQVAIVFQDLRLFPNLTAMENVQLKNDLTRFKTEDQIREMAALLGVDGLLNKKCGEMSYGQRQRFAIVRALCQPFKTLLMDEPFSHLDKNNITLCCQLITQECAAQQAGYLLASLGDKYDLPYDIEWSL